MSKTVVTEPSNLSTPEKKQQQAEKIIRAMEQEFYNIKSFIAGQLLGLARKNNGTISLKKEEYAQMCDTLLNATDLKKQNNSDIKSIKHTIHTLKAKMEPEVKEEILAEYFEDFNKKLEPFEIEMRDLLSTEQGIREIIKGPLKVNLLDSAFLLGVNKPELYPQIVPYIKIPAFLQTHMLHTNYKLSPTVQKLINTAVLKTFATKIEESASKSYGDFNPNQFPNKATSSAVSKELASTINNILNAHSIVLLAIDKLSMGKTLSTKQSAYLEKQSEQITSILCPIIAKFNESYLENNESQIIAQLTKELQCNGHYIKNRFTISTNKLINVSTKLADSPQVEKIKLINNPELISLQKSSELTPDIVNNKELSPKEIIESHVMLQEISQIPLRLQKYFSHDFPALFSPDNQIILVNKWLKMEEANRTNNQLIWKIREAKFKIENMAIKPDDHIKPLVKHASSSELKGDEGEKTIAYSSVAQEPRSDSTCDLSAEYKPQKESIVNSGEFGARSDGATPIDNRQALSDDVTNFSSIDYSVANQIASLPISKELDPAKVSNPTFSDNLLPEAECSKSVTPILTPNISIAPLQNGQNHVIISSPEIMDEGNSSSSLMPFPESNHHVAVLHELPSSPTNMYAPVQGTHTPNANLVLGDGIIPPETTPEIGKSKQTITNSSSWSYKAPFSYLSFLAHKATEFVHNITSLVQKELECSSTFSSSFDYSAESLQLAGDSADPLEGNIIVYKYLL